VLPGDKLSGDVTLAIVKAFARLTVAVLVVVAIGIGVSA